MSYRDVIVTKLRARTALTALVDDRIYWDFADSEAPRTPFVVLFDVSLSPRIALDGGTQFEHRFQAMIAADTALAAQGVYEQVLATLHPLRDLANGISFCRVANLNTQHDAGSGTHTWNADFLLVTT